MSDPTLLQSTINLSLLPAPTAIETLDYEAIVAAIAVDFKDRFPSWTANVESDPAMKLIEAFAYRELILRQRINDAVKASMIAFAVGPDLDNLAAFYGVTRATDEIDARLRARVVLAPDAMSVAGPTGAYVFQAMTAEPRVVNVSVQEPRPGRVLVTVLLAPNDQGGIADAPMCLAIQNVLNATVRRPATDVVQVAPANVILYDVRAELTVYPDPDQVAVLTAAGTALAAYASSIYRLGYDLSLSGLYGALQQAGVQSVKLISPAAPITVTMSQALKLGSSTVTIAAQGI